MSHSSQKKGWFVFRTKYYRNFLWETGAWTITRKFLEVTPGVISFQIAVPVLGIISSLSTLASALESKDAFCLGSLQDQHVWTMFLFSFPGLCLCFLFLTFSSGAVPAVLRAGRITFAPAKSMPLSPYAQRQINTHLYDQTYFSEMLHFYMLSKFQKK